MAFLTDRGREVAAGVAGIVYVLRPGEAAQLRERMDALRDRMAYLFPVPYELVDIDADAEAWLRARIAEAASRPSIQR